MKFVRPNPAKNWTLLRHNREDGTSVVLSGYGAGIPSSWHQDRDTGEWYTTTWTPNYEDRKRVTLNVEEIDNFVFYARMHYTSYSKGRSSVAFSFDDDDGLHQYQMSLSTFAQLFVELQEGNRKFDADGYIEGLWTFKKQGFEIYTYPVNE